MPSPSPPLEPPHPLPRKRRLWDPQPRGGYPPPKSQIAAGAASFLSSDCGAYSASVARHGFGTRAAVPIFERRVRSPAAFPPLRSGMLRDQGRGDGGLGVLREGGGL